MKAYMCLKMVTSYCSAGVIVIDLSKRGKSIRVTGNIPRLYHGMIIDFELNEKNEALDYTLLLNEKNRKALEKAKVDVARYQKTLNRHLMLKERGIDWEHSERSADELYGDLSFGDADKIHKAVINDATDPVRLKAINKRIIEGARKRRKIAYKIEEYLSYFDAVEQEGAYQQLMVSLKMMSLQASQYSLKNGNIWDKELKSKEDFVKENIHQRINAEYSLLTSEEINEFITTLKGCTLEQEQLNTVWSLKDSVPCIITGGAGTGKTTVIQTLIDCYTKHYSRDNILLIAPTGKASRRIAEKTGMPASTIHKALRKNPEDNFVYYTAKNPLPHRLIIVDESSMIDTELMYDLLNAVDLTSKIIFVGDHNQLYPVGCGEPFFDFMQLPQLDVFRLTKNHRQAEETDILANAENVLKGQPLFSGRGVTVKDITFEEIGSILTELKNADGSVQIISPYNYLNVQINWFLKKGDDPFNVGDKVIMTHNTKEYCNGDIGVVTAVNDGSIDVDIDNNSVTVSYDKPNSVQIGGDDDVVDSESMFLEQRQTDKESDVMLAYSITIHKMQGSEADRVIVFLPKGDSMINRRMLYTAVTRARKKLEVYYYELR